MSVPRCAASLVVSGQVASSWIEPGHSRARSIRDPLRRACFLSVWFGAVAGVGVVIGFDGLRVDDASIVAWFVLHLERYH